MLGGLTSFVLPFVAGSTLLVAQDAGTLVLGETQAEPGATVTVSGSGFGDCLPPRVPDGGVPVVLIWDSTPLNDVGDPRVIDGGTFTASITVPRDARPGGHTVIARCEQRRFGGEGVALAEYVTGRTTLTVVATQPPTTAPPTTSRRTTPPTPTVTPETGGAIGPTPTFGPGQPPWELPEPAPVQTAGPLPLVAVVVVLGLLTLVISKMRARRRRPVANRTSTQQPARVPVVQAVGRAGPAAAPVARRTGPGRSHEIRVVGHPDPGVQVVRSNGGERPT